MASPRLKDKSFSLSKVVVIHNNITSINYERDGSIEGPQKVCTEGVSQGNDLHHNEIPRDISIAWYIGVCD